MVSYAKFMGRSIEITVSGGEILRQQIAKMWTCNTGSAGLSIVLPRATLAPMRRGGNIFIVYNAGPFALDVKDALGTTVFTIASGYVARIALYDNSTSAGSWIIRSKVRL